jgi:hypothetical protein
MTWTLERQPVRETGWGTPRRSRSIGDTVTLPAVAGALTVATYLYYGYTYAGWPGTAMLDFVLRVNGELQTDWQTDQPAPHFFVTHLLALAPGSWLEGVVLTLWIVGLLVLWGGFAEMCRALGASRFVALGAGLVAIPTGFGGFGWSEPIFGSMYPSQTAFAFSVAALPAALFGRRALAGALVGLAMLAHPSAGALAVPVVAVVLVATVGWTWRGAARFTIPLVALAVPALAPIVVGQGSPSTLSTRERFELLAIVRQPHHVLYSEFGGYEYARTALWAVLALVAVALLWRCRRARALAAGGVIALLGLAVGGIASELERPLLLLQAQLGRLSPFVVLVGIVAGAAALARVAGSWSAAILFATAIVVHPVANGLSGSLVSVSGVAALVLLVALVTATLVSRQVSRLLDGPIGWGLAALGAAGAVLLLAFALMTPSYRTVTARTAVVDLLAPATLLVCLALAAIGAGGLALLRTSRVVRVPSGRSVVVAPVLAAVVLANAVALVEADAYVAAQSTADRDWRDIAVTTRFRTAPDDLILTPPQNSGFRFLSHRPVVVEFGSFRYDSEDVNWARRIADATGDPRAVDPDFGTDVFARNALMREAYDRNIERSRLPICRYDVSYVVAEIPVSVPPWLERVAANETYALLRVRPGACSS